MKLLANLKNAAQKRAAYRRTLAELDALPQKVKTDLAMDHGRACDLARQAIYG
ncbi:MAG: hypothetical protein KJ731_09440 [Alphaproteobacteria bacterium]|jgi:hypothetical protein|uniref:DUF1127 domain-containing protein n=1 Tax=Celeribacter baekdonensis TaxID=875171 RepID=A0A1G7GEG3_9RHOB|nr:hypothetical protein [Celeribacter baekdonensis]MBU0641994.1 hypothetical protein [Alphaproteobacteria bacterium]MBU1278517.1 hypothetical protein [Alphaproteobacteria bacterium]MBU1571872.1 hypothetical protein [Alphaproteobacteria bacterium]MBU1828683.1 hypothetical protein [Alphaproteobacteria bacterium]MBU2079891.1 hypothetical protein [Alphaproteobacteria bacterium]